MADYKLSASLLEHEDDVRAVTFPDNKAVISASRDGTVRFWKPLSDKPPSFDAMITSHSAVFVNTVAYLPPNQQFAEGLIISGGNDAVIEVRQPLKASEDNAEALLLGHSNNICALDVDLTGKYIVSGSWDKEARIWSIGKWECDAILRGHEGSVWAVLAYDRETIITAGADKQIRVFHRSGKLQRIIAGSQDVVRALCRLPKGHLSGADFASAGNDAVIRLWSISGRQISTLHGHENFIYSLAVSSNGEFASSGEDRSLRIWKGTECIQTIVHPAISVWGVAFCAENADIVTGASDRVVRVFTRAAERFASAEAIHQFESSVKESAIPQQALGKSINKEKLPGPEFLQQKSGTKEGQVQMINQPGGSVTAHMWSGGKWVDVGTVVDTAGSSGKKVDYLGQDYDYVFDVDIEEGKPPLKLPFNLSQNPYEAATRFLQDNELPMTYLDQVANFILSNAQGATIGHTSQSTGSDPWGSDTRYRPGDAAAAAAASGPPPVAKLLPQKSYLSILNSNLSKLVTKVEQLNTNLISSGHKDLCLNPSGVTSLNTLKRYLETPVTSSTNTTTRSSVQSGLPLAIKISTTWPYADRLPGFDLLRLLAPEPATALYTTTLAGKELNIIDLLISAVNDTPTPGRNCAMMLIRFFSNLFLSCEGRALALINFSKIQDFITSTLSGVCKGDRNSAVAAATVWINYSVLFAEEEVAQVFENGLAVLTSLQSILDDAEEREKDTEVIFRALVAAGTMMKIADEFKSAGKEVLALRTIVGKIASGKVEKRVRDLAVEVGVLLD